MAAKGNFESNLLSGSPNATRSRKRNTGDAGDGGRPIPRPALEIVAPKLPRGTRARLRTRAKLIDAAYRVMASKGVENTAIADITTAADVGFGSFYNHFETKRELAEAVFAVRAAEIASLTDAITRNEKDKAVATALIQRVFLTKAKEDPVWGWFLVEAQVSLRQMDETFSHQAIDDIRIGLKEGRFTVECVPTAVRITFAALVTTMRALMQGSAKASAVEETIECLLRMYGIAPEEAKSLSQRKLPSYVLDLWSHLHRSDG